MSFAGTIYKVTFLSFFQVGILQAARSGNAPTSSEMKAALRVTSPDAETYALPTAIEFATRELASELGFLTLCSEAEEHFEVAPVAFLAGYVARTCQEKVGTVFFLHKHSCCYKFCL